MAGMKFFLRRILAVVLLTTAAFAISPLHPAAKSSAGDQKPFLLLLFWADGCSHCEDEKQFLAQVAEQFPSLQVKSYEVVRNHKNAVLLEQLSGKFGFRPSVVPITFIGDEAFSGFSYSQKNDLVSIMKKCAKSGCPDPLDRLKNAVAPSVRQSSPQANDLLIDVPVFGNLDLNTMSLPVLTAVIAGIDSFNPCSFFVLLALLGLLIHTRSRARMLFIGSIFIFLSGFMYFLFMVAWLNLFLVIGQVALFTIIAGVVSMIIAGINIKDFFAFKQGVSLTIPESAKPKLYDRMRRLTRSTSFVSMAVGSAVLAISANSYGLICAAGFPMVFTRILTLHDLTTAAYYFYLVLYTIIYLTPLASVVILFTVTLGKRQLSERQGRVLKLVSGMMMLGLGIVLLVKPSLLNNALFSVSLLTAALLSSFIVAAFERRIRSAEQ